MHSLVSRQTPAILVIVSVVSAAALGCANPTIEEPRGTTSSSLDEPEIQDTDKDGVQDRDDCDPLASTLGQRYVEDDLATAKGLIRAATGFDDERWRHADGAWRQTTVRDRGDASLFVTETEGDLVVNAKMTVTKVSRFVEDLQQDFVLVGATSSGASFSAYGCGIEVVKGAFKTSLVKLEGEPAYVKTKVLKSVDRAGASSGEDGAVFSVTVNVTGSTLTCTVAQGSEKITIAALDVATSKGTVGFYTRSSAAAFRDARVCRAALR